MRRLIAYSLFSLSSVFRFFGKIIITKDKTIIVDVLTLPGWFIVDDYIIHHVTLPDKKSIGFQWDTCVMPDDWCKEMDLLKEG